MDLVEALLYRAEIALTLSDYQQARELLNRVREIPLDASEREQLTDILASADDLEAVRARP